MRKRRLLFYISLVGLMLFGIYLGNKEDRIIAHPNTPLELLPNTDKLFSIPVDSGVVYEKNIMEIYKDYAQGELPKEVDHLGYLKHKSYTIANSIRETEKYLDAVNIIGSEDLTMVLGQETTYSDTNQVNFTEDTFVAILDKDGSELKRDKSTRYYVGGNKISRVRQPVSYRKIIRVGKSNEFRVYWRTDTAQMVSVIKVSQDGVISETSQVVTGKMSGTYEKWYSSLNLMRKWPEVTGTEQYVYVQAQTKRGLADEMKNSKDPKFYFYQMNSSLTGTNTLWSIAPIPMTTLTNLHAGFSEYSVSDLRVTKKGTIGVLNVSGGGKSVTAIVQWNGTGGYQGVTMANKNVRLLDELPLNKSAERVQTLTYLNDSQEIVYAQYTYNLSSPVKDIRKFPIGSSLSFELDAENEELGFFGDIVNYTGDFFGKGEGRNLVIGKLDLTKNLALKRLDAVKTDVKLSLSKTIDLSDKRKLLIGSHGLRSKETIEIGSYLNKKPSVSFSYAITIDEEIDYPPVINQLNNTKIDRLKDDTSISEMLLTDVEVYDFYDLNANNVSGWETEKWLYNRINRNPNTLKYADDGETLSIAQEDVEGNKIHWDKLGFDKTKTGPQLVTYFVTDSQKQATSTSRWVHAVDSHVSENETTVDAEKFYLRAENISINKKDVSGITNQAIWEAAKAKVWKHNLDKDKETIAQPYEEAYEFNSEEQEPWGYQFNDKQLKAIKGAKEEKPYPLDVSYTDSRLGQTVTHRIWVFVTNDQTTVDKENDVVMYVNDYVRPLHEAKNETKEKMWGYTEGLPAVGEVPAKPEVPGADVKVYDYQDTYNKTTELPTIADKTEGKQTGLGVNGTYLTAINKAVKDDPNNPKYPKYPAQITYTKDEKVSTANLTVTLEQKQADVTIQFHDEDGEQITNETGTPIDNIVLKDQNIEEEIDLTKEPLIKEVLDGVNKGNGYQVIDSPTSHIVKTDAKENVVTYVFEGQINFGTVTNELTFQQGFIKPNNQTLEYNSKEDFVVNVADNRNYKEVPATGDRPKKLKKRGNFDVQVKLTQPFKHDGEEGQVKGQPLEGAVLRYTPATSEVPIDITGAEAATVTRSTQTTTEPDKKQFSLKLDDKDKSSKTGKGWSLFVPQGNVQKGTYVAELTWYLSTGP